jgi:hypothetical protein
MWYVPKKSLSEPFPSPYTPGNHGVSAYYEGGFLQRYLPIEEAVPEADSLIPLSDHFHGSTCPYIVHTNVHFGGSFKHGMPVFVIQVQFDSLLATQWTVEHTGISMSLKLNSPHCAVDTNSFLQQLGHYKWWRVSQQ